MTLPLWKLEKATMWENGFHIAKPTVTVLNTEHGIQRAYRAELDRYGNVVRVFPLDGNAPDKTLRERMTKCCE